MIFRKGSFVILAAALAASCTNSSSLSDDEISQINSVEDRYRAAWLSNDSTRVLATLSKDIILMPPGPSAEKIKGREAVKQFWFPDTDMVYRITSFDIGTPEIVGSGDYANLIAESYLTWNTVSHDSILATSSSRSEFISVLKKEDGHWKIWRQIWNAKAPRKVD